MDDMLPLLGHNMNGNEESDSDSSDSETEGAEESNDAEKVPSGENITFDQSLPGAHSYLGDDLEEVRGRTVHEDDSLQSIPLMALPGVVLVPGQQLPLHLFHPQTVAMMKHCVRDGDKTFGLVTSSYRANDYTRPTLASIGTTAEIFSMKEEMEEHSGISTMRVKAIGRQRFEIVDSRRQTDGNTVARVRILPEKYLPDSLEGARPPSHKKFICRCPVGPSENEERPVPGAYYNYGMGETVLPVTTQKLLREVGKFSSAHLTWWPPWVYKMYDAQLLAKKIQHELQSWNMAVSADKMPKNPIDLSYWILGNLPVDDNMRLNILRIDSAVQRLRCELSIMQKCTVLCCKDCNQQITSKKDVFSMALEGPMAAYVNPGGYVHETLTVYKITGLNHIGRPQTENSWFPGYAWTIVQCRQCASHMGWRFTAVKKLQPEKFWGLCRASLIPGLQASDTETDEEDRLLPML